MQTKNIWQLVYDAHCFDKETNIHQTRVHGIPPNIFILVVQKKKTVTSDNSNSNSVHSVLGLSTQPNDTIHNLRIMYVC